ncbi:zona pellucida sperm-binding protein 3d.2 isoform X1 [Salminus brasiliensis]|uniref:zona pellucida sperm-binding protein 3d.2 isoform X1 n=1 Tax=Salminus brasiliensis TaxID=930266 RepID=UPI003B838CF1
MGVIFPCMCVLLGVLSPCARAQVSSSDWTELESRTDEGSDRLGSPYLELPVFLHSRVPLLDKAEFSPARASGLQGLQGLQGLPQRVRNVLVPSTELSRRSSTESGPSRLRVACNSKQMRVKVSRETLDSVDAVRLGTCGVSWSTQQHLFFLYDLQQCGTSTEIINNRVVYSNTLHYTPDETLGAAGSPSSFSIPIQCHFNRFHYSYKVGFVPRAKTQRLLKPIKAQGGIMLTPHDAQWNRLNPSEGYVLGQPMYFEAEAGSVSEGERLFVQSCHVTVNSSRLSSPRVTIIDNYGCMIDSQSSAGSRFMRSSRRNAVRFSVDAFVLRGKPSKVIEQHQVVPAAAAGPLSPSVFSNSICTCTVSCPSAVRVQQKRQSSAVTTRGETGGRSSTVPMQFAPAATPHVSLAPPLRPPEQSAVSRGSWWWRSISEAEKVLKSYWTPRQQNLHLQH